MDGASAVRWRQLKRPVSGTGKFYLSGRNEGAKP
jgi:hypothetical protein